MNHPVCDSVLDSSIFTSLHSEFNRTKMSVGLHCSWNKTQVLGSALKITSYPALVYSVIQAPLQSVRCLLEWGHPPTPLVQLEKKHFHQVGFYVNSFLGLNNPFELLGFFSLLYLFDVLTLLKMFPPPGLYSQPVGLQLPKYPCSSFKIQSKYSLSHGTILGLSPTHTHLTQLLKCL